MRTRDLRSLAALAAGLGLLVSLFAAAEFFDASLRAICSVNGSISCGAVDQSGRTSTLFVPDYLWGVGGFVALLVVAAIAERRPADLRWAYGFVGLASAGVALSAYLLYVELALIHALCPVCVAAYLLGAVVWVSAIALLRRARARAARADDADRPSAEAA